MLSNPTKTLVAAMAAVLIVAGLALLIPARTQHTYADNHAQSLVGHPDAGTSDTSEQQSKIVPADPMNQNVRWAPSTGEN